MSRGALYALLALIPAVGIGVGYMACSGGDEAVVNESAIMEAESKAIAGVGDPRIVGTWRTTTVTPGNVTLFTFKTDGTFARGMAVACATVPCPDVLTQGKYKTFTRDAQTYISLQENDMITDRYEYKYVDNNTLRILRLGKGSQWQSITKSADKAWCGVANDCAIQGLPVGPCAGQWMCGLNVCSYQCGAPQCDSAKGEVCPPPGPSPDVK